jgi:hypothetical protein
MSRLASSPGPVVTTTGRGCVSPPGLLNANLCGSISLYCMGSHMWPLQPSSLTRGRPPKNGIGRCTLTIKGISHSLPMAEKQRETQRHRDHRVKCSCSLCGLCASVFQNSVC